mmetsp:Transcript_21929/g.75361  ORF Transcript_21929/g.75361 Transcript_21929/m.75361 type:complete len:215 (+) Transcript_21929:1152-1796(+)
MPSSSRGAACGAPTAAPRRGAASGPTAVRRRRAADALWARNVGGRGRRYALLQGQLRRRDGRLGRTAAARRRAARAQRRGPRGRCGADAGAGDACAPTAARAVGAQGPQVAVRAGPRQPAEEQMGVCLPPGPGEPLPRPSLPRPWLHPRTLGYGRHAVLRAARGARRQDPPLRVATRRVRRLAHARLAGVRLGRRAADAAAEHPRHDQGEAEAR